MHRKQQYARIGLMILLLAGVAGVDTVDGQTWQERREVREYTSPEAIVSMDRNFTFDRAIEALNELSKKFTGKIIIDPGERTKEIGIHIESMHWRDAFERILRHNDLWYDERANHFMIKVPAEVAVREVDVPVDPDRPTLKTREVNISAVFFEVSHSKLRESGIRWDFLRPDKFGEIGADLATRRPTLPSPQLGIIEREGRGLTIDVKPDWSFANLHAIIQLFESTDIGEVIASPEVTVRSGQTGSIQVGEDISIKQRDFAGNIIDQFISTGTIINVIPEVYVEDGIPFISLDISAERSTGTPGEISTIISKAEAETRVLLLDGEETVIGGLYVTEERVLREGVPLLKDLPWWFFGLRYLFGYNRIQKDTQELIILLRASLVPTLEERIATKREQNLIQERRRQYQEEMERLREPDNVRKER